MHIHGYGHCDIRLPQEVQTQVLAGGKGATAPLGTRSKVRDASCSRRVQSQCLGRA